ncbi:MAG: FGGY family carbohydrate kinase [Sulfolobales archaeon]|nr:FGGY family carbohydrate kinase [Sulfolobales archaeon]
MKINIVSVDLGTTNVKVALIKFDEKSEKFEVLKSESYRVDPVVEGPGAYEHGPGQVVSYVKQLVKKISKSGNVDSIVLASYLFGLAVADSRLNYLTNIITWMDERPYVVLGELRKYAKEIYLRTGCPLLHIYALPKILWIKKYSKDKFNQGAYFLDSKSLLVHSLAGEVVTDLSSASGTYQLLNIKSLSWDDFALSLAGIDESNLPEVREGYAYGYLREEVAAELGVGRKTPVVIGLYDGASMIYGMSGSLGGVGIVNLGSSAMIRVVVEEPSIDSSPLMRFQTYYLVDRRWLAGGAINNAGVVVEYVIKLLYGVDTRRAEEFEKILESASCRAETNSVTSVPLVLPERFPFLDFNRRMSFIGLTQSTQKEDLVLSTVEGVLMLLAYISRSMESSGVNYREVRVGGKLASYRCIREMLANVLNKPVYSSVVADSSHLGNVLLSLKALKHVSQRELYRLVDSSILRAEPAYPRAERVVEYGKKFTEFSFVLEKLYLRPDFL